MNEQQGKCMLEMKSRVCQSMDIYSQWTFTKQLLGVRHRAKFWQ